MLLLTQTLTHTQTLVHVQTPQMTLGFSCFSTWVCGVLAWLSVHLKEETVVSLGNALPTETTAAAVDPRSVLRREKWLRNVGERAAFSPTPEENTEIGMWLQRLTKKAQQCYLLVGLPRLVD